LQTSDAADYANKLLADLGETERISTASDHPALAWRRSGLLTTTRLMLPTPLSAHADGALYALQTLAPNADLPKSGAQILGERARLRETVRQGRQCAGGYGRLMDTKSGRIALNLVRDDDWDLVPAWLEEYVEDWDGISQHVQHRDADELVERAAEIGLAVAKDELPKRPGKWFDTQRFSPGEIKSEPLIVDLSGLWAGPLATSLIGMTGARVVKVESPTRPDGMRLGHEGFYQLINAGKDCVALNFRDEQDLARLKKLLEKADIVIEASRPRALMQLGIVAEEFVARKPGKTWARLTAYGRKENRIGFGDDIGVAAGLSTVMDMAHGEPCFVGDAIADPVNGLHLALILKSFANRGGGAVIDLCMRDVLRFAMGEVPTNSSDIARAWSAIAQADTAQLYSMREPRGQTKPLGADTDRLC